MSAANSGKKRLYDECDALATSLLLLARLRRKTRATLDAIAVERAGADPLFITLSLIEKVRAMAPPRAAPRPKRKRGKKTT
jgi:hypothetical protein